MYMIFKTAIVLILASVGQSIQTEWRVDLNTTAADKNAILELAREFGIDHPRLVSFDSTLPGGCPFVRVESAIEEQGYRRSWRELVLRNRKWRRCFEVPWRALVKRKGRWVASNAQLSMEEDWRIEDQGWYVDLRPGPGVSYEDVKLIVSAIHRGELINRLPTSIGAIPLNATLPDIDANDITSIEKSNDALRTYQVRTGKASGLLLHLKIIDKKVELHSYGTWIVKLDKPPDPRLQTRREFATNLGYLRPNHRDHVTIHDGRRMGDTDLQC